MSVLFTSVTVHCENHSRIHPSSSFEKENNENFFRYKSFIVLQSAKRTEEVISALIFSLNAFKSCKIEINVFASTFSRVHE